MIVSVGQNVNVNVQVFLYFECIALAAGNISELRNGQRAFGRRKNRLRDQTVKQE